MIIMPTQRGTAQFRQTLTTYAVGVSQDTKTALADFFAPRVPTGSGIGYYKAYSDKNDFQKYSTVRAVGGTATRIRLDAEDKTYNCAPNALEVAIDDVERERAGEAVNQLEEAKVRSLVISAALAREDRVLKKVRTGVTAASGLGVWSNAANDPIAELDQLIQEIADETGILPNAMALGLSTWRVLKNHPKVVGRRSGAATAVVGLRDLADMLLNPSIDIRIGMMSLDKNKFGKEKNAEVLIGADLFVFCRQDSPTVFDPSFCKTFSVGTSSVDAVRQYRDETCRSDIYAVDWSEDIQVVAPTACRRITLS